jgi:hypothetical protein
MIPGQYADPDQLLSHYFDSQRAEPVGRKTPKWVVETSPDVSSLFTPSLGMELMLSLLVSTSRQHHRLWSHDCLRP